MKKKAILLLFIVVLFPTMVDAKRGCCSHHGGVAGCSSSGRQICRDGTLSPTCTCSSSTNANKSNTTSKPSTKNSNAKKDIYGCTDKTAFNYNAKATKDNGSCIAKKLGCTDKSAINYDKTANTRDDSCQYVKKEKEIESILYDTEYMGTEKSDKTQEKVIQKGKNGKKEVTYKMIVDQTGKVLSKEKESETVLEEPLKEIIETETIPLSQFSTQVEVEKVENKKEENNPFTGVWMLCLLISFLYFWSHKDGGLLLNKIANFNSKWIRIIFYLSYVLLIIPPFIDSFTCLLIMIKKDRKIR